MSYDSTYMNSPEEASSKRWEVNQRLSGPAVATDKPGVSPSGRENVLE